jgi:bZIP transcription factor
MKRSGGISWNGIGKSDDPKEGLMILFCSLLMCGHPSSVAALKCRQRKKQWLENLQAKVEIFTTGNDALTATVTQLREEIVNLRTLLLAHKDCPVSQAQGLQFRSTIPYDYVKNGLGNL